MNSVLVLGANSRLGKALASSITTDTRFVLVARQAISTAGGNQTYIVDDYDRLPTACLRNIDSVVNCVGVSDPGFSETMLSHVNADIPVAVARQALDAGVRHFVQISSLSVLGGAEYIDEGTTVAPKSSYGRSKALAEARLNQLVREGLNPLILRFPMLYGLGAKTKLSQLANALWTTRLFPAAKSKPLRSILHVKNAAAVIANAVSKHTAGTSYAADRQPFEIEALAAALTEIKGARVRIVRLPDYFFFPIRMLSPSTFTSLFRPSLIASHVNVANSLDVPMTLTQGLIDLVAQI